MIKTTHTPGPWYAYKNRNPDGQGCDYTIATVPTEDKDLDDEGVDYTIAGIWSNKAIDEANANLMAAAPDLLNVLNWIVNCPTIKGPAGTTAYVISSKKMQEANTIIKQAKGE